jgi:hypothetical protein
MGIRQSPARHYLSRSGMALLPITGLCLLLKNQEVGFIETKGVRFIYAA